MPWIVGGMFLAGLLMYLSRKKKPTEPKMLPPDKDPWENTR